VIMRTSDYFGQEMIAGALSWFTSSEAEGVVSHHREAIPGLGQFFGFARALASGCAFAVKIGQVVQFVGWRRKIKLRSGMILLDATADIDGVSHIVPWRQHTETPKAHYGNLKIVHIPQHTKKRLSEYLKIATNQRAYVEWMVQTIEQHMVPGERG